MIEFRVYPGGKRNVVTFSYDDGAPEDKRLVELFNKYGVKATFHLCGTNYKDCTDSELEKIRKLYEGHEISCHSFSHGFLTRMPQTSIINEVMEDRRMLERLAGYPVVGMSYPCGVYNKRLKDTLKACGILYCRTVTATNGSGVPNDYLPYDFLEWNPTCHQKNALPICEEFMKNPTDTWSSPMLYIWGHSHELITEEKWQHVENILKLVSGCDDIWYATNMEIYEYMTAQRRLVVSADESMIYNPSGIEVYVEKDGKHIIKIPPRQTVYI